jgi:glycosyltransferase involved in cell wall biosynthesis
VEVARTPGWGDAGPAQVAAIVPLYQQSGSVGSTLESLARSTHRDWEAVVIDDASTDGSSAAVRAWMAAHPEERVLLLREEVNRGLAAARNTGIEQSRTELLLMLDADNCMRPFGLSRLLGALEQDPAASFAYGIMERFSGEGPLGVWNPFAWEPRRFRRGNFVDALALIRRTALEEMGGYSSDPRLWGWEDFDLWARLAEAGHHGAFVPQMVARYHFGETNLRSLAGISITDAFSAVVEHAPTLMKGVEIPD